MFDVINKYESVLMHVFFVNLCVFFVALCDIAMPNYFIQASLFYRLLSESTTPSKTMTRPEIFKRVTVSPRIIKEKIKAKTGTRLV